MHVLYISVGGEDRIACFRRSTLTGSLSHLADAPVPGSPGALCLLSGSGVGGQQQRLFCACIRSSSGSEEPQGGIATLAVDEVSGGLTEIGWVPAAFNEAPCYLATDPTGRWLLTAHYSRGACAIHPIADGLAGAVSQEVETAPQAHCIETDPTGSFVFVPHVVRRTTALCWGRWGERPLGETQSVVPRTAATRFTCSNSTLPPAGSRPTPPLSWKARPSAPRTRSASTHRRVR